MGYLEQDVYELAVGLRHELHAHPELSLHEEWTRRRLLGFLRKHTQGLQIVDPNDADAGTAQPGSGERPASRRGYFFCRYDPPADGAAGASAAHGHPAVMLRADFDALPIDEHLDVSWTSQVPGVSHKCGHDGHAATLAALAIELDRRGADRPVVLLFQDAEEIGAGAKVAREVITSQNVGEAYAIHNWSGMAAGTVNVVDGVTMPASMGLAIEWHGRASHAAEPEHGANPARAIAQVVGALPEIAEGAARHGYAFATVVQMAVGSGDFGVSPGEGVLKLTLRAQDDGDLAALEGGVRELAARLAREQGMGVDFATFDEFPATANDPTCVQRVREAAAAAGIAWRDLPQPSPVRASEDFGWYAQQVPSCLFYVGNGFDHADVHTTGFDFVDENIRVGVEVFGQLVGLHGPHDLR